MGLDQYAFVTTQDNTKYRDDGVIGIKDGEDLVEVAYWRKHPYLQGFMQQLWEGHEDFNCVYVEVTEEVLDDLEDAVSREVLPETSGFFFGSDSSHEYKAYDLAFIKEARQAIKDGKVVVYTSWW